MSASSSLGWGERHRQPEPCIILRKWLGTWNIRGINGTAKGEEVVVAFRRGKFELLALKETKLEGMVWGKWYKCRCSGDGK